MVYGEDTAPLEDGTSDGGQPAGTPPEQAEQTVPRSEFEKLQESIESLRREFRVVQGSANHSEAVVKKILAERMTKIDDYSAKAGLDKSQADDLKREIIREEAQRYISAEQAEPVSQPASRKLSPPDQKAIDEVNTWMRDRSDNAGIPLFDVDPEFATVDWTSPPDTFKEQFEAALSAKAKRLGREIPAATPAPNRSPGIVGGGMAGNHVEQLNKRLIEIQNTDPFGRDKALLKERKGILEEMKRLE